MTIKARIQGGVRTNHSTPYQRSYGFDFNMTNGNGPSPGLVVATPQGTEVDLSQLVNPVFGMVINESDVAIELGIFNSDQAEFYPFMRVPPRKALPWFCSPNILGEYASGTGTGLTGQSNKLMAKSMGSSDAYVIIELFDE